MNEQYEAWITTDGNYATKKIFDSLDEAIDFYDYQLEQSTKFHTTTNLDAGIWIQTKHPSKICEFRRDNNRIPEAYVTNHHPKIIEVHNKIYKLYFEKIEYIYNTMKELIENDDINVRDDYNDEN